MSEVSVRRNRLCNLATFGTGRRKKQKKKKKETEKKKKKKKMKQKKKTHKRKKKKNQKKKKKKKKTKKKEKTRKKDQEDLTKKGFVSVQMSILCLQTPSCCSCNIRPPSSGLPVRVGGMSEATKFVSVPTSTSLWLRPCGTVVAVQRWPSTHSEHVVGVGVVEIRDMFVLMFGDSPWSVSL